MQVWHNPIEDAEWSITAALLHRFTISPLVKYWLVFDSGGQNVPKKRPAYAASVDESLAGL